MTNDEMRNDDTWIEKRKSARFAGFLYLIVVVTGFFSIAYVPMQITVKGDAAATMANLLAQKSLFQLSIIAGVICYTAFVVLPLVLFKLLNHISRIAGVLMVAFALVSVPISLLNLRSRLDVLSLLGSLDNVGTVAQESLQVPVIAALDAYSNGILICTIFWGLWLLPFGYLVWKSGFLPKVFGFFLMAGCFGYLISFCGNIFVAGYAETTVSSLIALPSAIGEIGICFWLLIVGIRKSRESEASPH
jgi:Domain of unknown function (DUF4386)